MTRTMITATAVVGLLVLGTGTVQADLLYSVADSQVLAGVNATKNTTPDPVGSGTSTTMRIGTRDTSGNGTDPYTAKAYLKFDLSSVPSQGVASATLTLMGGTSGHLVRLVAVTGTDNSWTETGITWNTAPGNLTAGTAGSSGNFDSTKTVVIGAVNSASNTVTYDVAAFVNWALALNASFDSRFAAQNDFITFALSAPSTAGAYNNAGTWYSHEWSTGSQRPQIAYVANPTPEPATMAFLAIGGIGVAAGRLIRRRRSVR
ncbi:MAG: DNRLRE domain-containing protein [Phycisphaerae bacterium]|nr:DNRLRE domain-containing protein [Phycisphaerae bacterium]